MGETAISVLLRHLGYAWPGLLVAFVGFVVGIANLRRYPGAAFLSSLSCALLMGAWVGSMLIEAYLMQWQMDGSLSIDRVMEWLRLMNGIHAIIHASALGLLLVAVYYGRSGTRAETDPIQS